MNKVILLLVLVSLPSCGMMPSTKSSMEAENVESMESTVVNSVENGIPYHWGIVGALLFGMIIPQPRFIKWLF
jgi:hypothetical protein